MKKVVSNLNDALAFELEGMYEVIKGLQAEVSKSLKHISVPALRDLLVNYSSTLEDQRTKLKRIFSYVLDGPYNRHLNKVAGFIAQFKEINSRAYEPSLLALLFVSTLVSAAQYKVAALEEARFLAMRLELEQVETLLDEMIALEKEFAQTLKRLSAKQVTIAYKLTMVS